MTWEVEKGLGPGLTVDTAYRLYRVESGSGSRTLEGMKCVVWGDRAAPHLIQLSLEEEICPSPGLHWRAVEW